VYANTQDSDLGSVAAKVNRIVREESKNLPPGTKIIVRGQVESMNEAFNRLGLGLAFAALLVYLFDGGQLPELARSLHHHLRSSGRVLRQFVWALFLTQTTFNVPV